MRVTVLIVLATLLGCGGDDDSASNEVRALVADTVDAYDRQFEIQCPCYVQLGAFESVESCMTLVGSGPDWVDCATEVLEENDSPEVRQEVRCSLEQTRAQSDCYEEAMCDLGMSAECQQIDLGCEERDNPLLLLVLERCPDLGLLSRPEAQTP